MRPTLVALFALAAAAAAVSLVRTHRDTSAPEPGASAPPPEAGTPSDPGARLEAAATRELSGVVVDRRASPAAGVEVIAARAPDALAALHECVRWQFPAFARAGCGCGAGAQHVAEAVAHLAPPVEVARAITDANGRFRLAGLPPDADVFITARAGDASAAAAARAGLRLELQPMVTLEGDVKDELGMPLANAAVAVLDGVAAHTLTDRAGHFTLPAVSGQVRVAASAPGRVAALWAVDGETSLSLVLPTPITVRGRVVRQGVPVAGAKVRQTYGPCGLETASAADGTFELTNMRAQHLAFEATSGSRLGHLDVPSPRAGDVLVIELVDGVLVQGHAFGLDGEPVAGAHVELDIDPPSAQRRGVTAEADGHFTAGPLQPGAWTVTIEAPGYLRCTQKQTLSAPAAQLELQLKKGRGISGQVVDRSGAPIENAWVHDMASAFRGQTERTWTAADGRFDLVNLGPGEHELEVTAPDLAPAHVTATSPADVTVTLAPGAFISGRVLDHAGAKIAVPVPPKDPLQRANAAFAMMGRRPSALDGVRMEVHTVDGEEKTWADGQPDGTFRAGPLAAGDYEVCADLGTRHACAKATVVAGARQTLDVTLPDSLTISGVVKGPTGGFVAGARVTLSEALDALHRETGHAVSDPAGAFRIDDVMEGEHWISARAKGLTTHQPSNVRAGETGVVLTLEEGRFITGRVVGDDGPVTTARVWRTQVDTDGRFELEGGLQLLRVTAEGYAPLEQKVDASNTGSIDVGDLRLSRGFTVRGVVADAAQTPVVGAWVFCASSTDKTDAAGRFKCSNLASGRQDVRVQLTGWLPAQVSVEVPAVDLYITLNHGQRITGRVVDEDGVPMPRVQVTAAGHDGAGVRAESGADGAFELTGVPAGTTSVASFGNERVRFEPVTLEVAEGHDAEVVLKGRVHGTRLRLKHGDGLIALLGNPAAAAEQLDADEGRHEDLRFNGDLLWVALPVGRFELTVMSIGSPKALSFDVDSSGSGEVVIELSADERKTLGLPPRG